MVYHRFGHTRRETFWKADALSGRALHYVERVGSQNLAKSTIKPTKYFGVMLDKKVKWDVPRGTAVSWEMIT